MENREAAGAERHRILVVDDEPINIHVLVELLEDEHEIAWARDGESALRQALLGTAPDLVLLDVVMPGMDGYEVCRRLKAEERTRDTAVVFVTGLSDDADEARGLALGAVDYITKPVSPAIVRARVRTQLALRDTLAAQKATNAQLRDLNDLKNKLLGMAAHDLRNPLTAILGLSQVLVETEFPPEKRKPLLASIYRSSAHMLALVNDLLDVSVIESGRFDLDLQPRDLGEFLHERAELMSLTSQAKSIGIHVEVSEVGSFPFDQDRIAQVVDNLLSNGVKFSPRGTTVRVFARADGGEATIAVTDEGPGIAPGDLHKLFGTFQRLSARPTGGEKSTGLGLAIVKKIVEAHGGRVEVTSTPGQGATFTVTLPMTSAPSPPPL